MFSQNNLIVFFFSFVDYLSEALVGGRQGFSLLSQILVIFLQILLQERSTKVCYIFLSYMKKCKMKVFSSVHCDGRADSYGSVQNWSLIISAIKNAMYCNGIVLSTPFFFEKPTLQINKTFIYIHSL